MTGAPSTMPIGRFVFVLDGRTCLGHIVNRAKLGFEAYTRDDQSRGIFPTMARA